MDRYIDAQPGLRSSEHVPSSRHRADQASLSCRTHRTTPKALENRQARSFALCKLQFKNLQICTLELLSEKQTKRFVLFCPNSEIWVFLADPPRRRLPERPGRFSSMWRDQKWGCGVCSACGRPVHLHPVKTKMTCIGDHRSARSTLVAIFK